MPYASVCVGKYLESMLSDIPRHPHPRLPDGRLKRHKYKKSAVGGKKTAAYWEPFPSRLENPFPSLLKMRKFFLAVL